MRRVLTGLALVVIVAGILYLRHRPPRSVPEEAYTAGRRVIVWSSTAQVREPLLTLDYGDRLDVLSREDEEVRVRTGHGVTGWVDSRELMSADLWHRASLLVVQTRQIPVQARGRTKVVSNLRIEPGRAGARLLQLERDVSVEILERRAAPAPLPSAGSEGGEGEKPRAEDWWLVRARVQDRTDVAGWMLGRFIELDLPSPLLDYTSSEDYDPVAWFEVSFVTNPSGGRIPEYLVAGRRGQEGQPCDFTLLRVYTWSKKRRMYETAYVEGGLCGSLPIRVSPAKKPGGEASFWFANVGGQGKQERTYRMVWTTVRRVRTRR